MRVKASVIIPFFRRHNNLFHCLETLSKQKNIDFEVIVSAYLADKELTDILNIFKNKLKISLINTTKVERTEWNVSYIRNKGLEHATGEVVIFIDADIIVPPFFVEAHVSAHYIDNFCLVIGPVYGFNPYVKTDSLRDCNKPRIVSNVINNELDLRKVEDKRLKVINKVHSPLRWAFAWAGNVSILKKYVLKYQLYFDDKFEGWGVEDLEWSYRATSVGMNIAIRENCWGYHLPHFRDVKKNIAYESQNFEYFLNKWTNVEVEVVCRYNDFKGYLMYPFLKYELSKFNIWPPYVGYKQGVVMLGLDHAMLSQLDTHSFRLLGVRLPFIDKQFDVAYLSSLIPNVSKSIFNDIENEASRVAKKVKIVDKDLILMEII